MFVHQPANDNEMQFGKKCQHGILDLCNGFAYVLLMIVQFVEEKHGNKPRKTAFYYGRVSGNVAKQRTEDGI
jgi:hypothetical protein